MLDDALISISKAIELSPTENDYHQTKGLILQEMGGHEKEAREAFAHAK
jgi:hypothetical protein